MLMHMHLAVTCTFHFDPRKIDERALSETRPSGSPYNPCEISYICQMAQSRPQIQPPTLALTPAPPSREAAPHPQNHGA